MSVVHYNVENRIAYITLTRPEKRNALNADMVTALKCAFENAKNDELAKVIVLKAEGDVFCAGADLAYLQQLQQNTYDENLADSIHLKSLFHQIYTLPKVVIAKIQGHAIAGGCGLASVCDFSFTVPDTKFGYTEVRIGFIPAIVSPFLLRKIGEGKAKELLLSGELINAEKAVSLGLINKVVSRDELDQAVDSFAQNIIKKNSTESMAMTKEIIANVQGMGLNEGLIYASEMNAKARSTEDCKKGMAAFLNKEKHNW
jgi:methylglutaconyl-CoA hydratase